MGEGVGVGMFNVPPENVAAPLVPVVVNVIAPCFPLKVFQSVEERSPCCEPLAVAIAKVIVPFVVIGVLPIVTPLVADDRPTDVTVPAPEVISTLQFALPGAHAGSSVSPGEYSDSGGRAKVIAPA